MDLLEQIVSRFVADGYKDEEIRRMLIGFALAVMEDQHMQEELVQESNRFFDSEGNLI